MVSRCCNVFRAGVLTIVNHQECVLGVGPLGVGIYFRGNAVGRPTGVCDANVAVGLRFEVDISTCKDNVPVVIAQCISPESLTVCII